MSDFQTHYGIFWTDATTGARKWARSTVKRESLTFARRVAGDVYQVNHGRRMAWDAHTLRTVGTRIASFAPVERGASC